MYFRKLSLDEVVALVEHENDDETVEVYIEPPDANILTDEDSGDDDDVNHLSGNQLRALAEIKSRNEDEEQEAGFDVQQLIDSSKSLKWRNKKDVEPRNPLFPAGNYSRYKDFTPLELFELFFDDSPPAPY